MSVPNHEGTSERGGERFVLRRTPKMYKIVRLVDDIGFPGEPFWVEMETIWRGRSKAAATAFMAARSEARDG